VFITDNDKELLPSYLRFVRGVIDSEDLPLNVSREILQQNKILANIKSASVKKILSEIKKLSENQETFKVFQQEFGRCIKEGLYSDYANRDELLELVRFKTTKEDSYTSFAEYKTRMKADQKAIYYIAGLNESLLRNSPLLEAYRAKEIEVLIMDDEIDEIVLSHINEYKGTPIKAINKSNSTEDISDKIDENVIKESEPIVKKIKDTLGDAIKDVKLTARLSSSPACLVLDENDPSVQMQQMFKMMGNMPLPDIKPILELNPNHEIIQKIGSIEDETISKDVCFLLFEQAQLIAGMTLKDPAAFGARLSRIVSKAI
jgi:molecular chaperone HtpG